MANKIKIKVTLELDEKSQVIIDRIQRALNKHTATAMTDEEMENWWREHLEPVERPDIIINFD